MKKNFLLFLLILCMLFSFVSCSKTKILKIEDFAEAEVSVYIEYEFDSFEDLKPGIYPVKYIVSLYNNSAISTSPAELYVSENIDKTKSFYITYISYGEIKVKNISEYVTECILNK